MGAGVGSQAGIYASEESDFGAGAYVAFDTEVLHLGLDGVSVGVVQGERFQVRVGLAPRWAPDFPETALFSGLDRDGTLEGTVSAVFHLNAALRATLDFRHDLLDEHGGYALELAARRGIAAGPVLVEASAGARHRDDDLNAHLIGVSTSEATAARNAYSPGSTTTPFVGISVTYPVGENVAMIGNVEYEYLGHAYRDSPLVEQAHASSVSFGIAYSF